MCSGKKIRSANLRVKVSSDHRGKRSEKSLKRARTLGENPSRGGGNFLHQSALLRKGRGNGKKETYPEGIDETREGFLIQKWGGGGFVGGGGGKVSPENGGRLRNGSNQSLKLREGKKDSI